MALLTWGGSPHPREVTMGAVCGVTFPKGGKVFGLTFLLRWGMVLLSLFGTIVGVVISP